MRRAKHVFGVVLKFWKSRAGQKEYWIGIAVLLVFGAALRVFGLNTGSALTVVWLLLWVRRLHDFGESGLWGLVPLGAMLVFAIGVFVVGGPEFNAAFAASSGRHHGFVTPAGTMMVAVFWLVMIFIQFGFTVWLGLKRGDDGDNAYGPPSQLFRRA
jgi:uncharacterized membrane protein YhaH (DUF805 family)